MKRALPSILSLLFVLTYCSTSDATNGDILIGIGVERGMGGAGVAAQTQDAAGSILLNPVSIVSNESTRIDVGSTFFFPGVTARANLGAGATFSFRDHYALSASYMHTFENSITETGTLDGTPVSIGSSLSEDTGTVIFHFNF